MEKQKKIKWNVFLYVLMWDIIKWILIYLLKKNRSNLGKMYFHNLFLRKMTPICRKAGVAERVNFYWENVLSTLCFSIYTFSATSLLFKFFFLYKKFRHDDLTYTIVGSNYRIGKKKITQKNSKRKMISTGVKRVIIWNLFKFRGC